MFGNPSLGLGEYLATWAIIAVVVIGVLGWVFGTGLGGALLFIVLGALAILVLYAVVVRLWRFLLHGSVSANSGSSGGSGGDI